MAVDAVLATIPAGMRLMPESGRWYASKARYEAVSLADPGDSQRDATSPLRSARQALHAAEAARGTDTAAHRRSRDQATPVYRYRPGVFRSPADRHRTPPCITWPKILAAGFSPLTHHPERRPGGSRRVHRRGFGLYSVSACSPPRVGIYQETGVTCSCSPSPHLDLHRSLHAGRREHFAQDSFLRGWSSSSCVLFVFAKQSGTVNWVLVSRSSRLHPWRRPGFCRGCGWMMNASSRLFPHHDRPSGCHVDLPDFGVINAVLKRRTKTNQDSQPIEHKPP